MGSFSLMHWVIVLIIVVLLFGGGRISSIMGDVAKGIKSFKKGMADDDEEPVQPKRPVAQIEAPPSRTIDGTAKSKAASEERKPG
ncbi:MAG: twin-arginine translocase TatA/TatE family subunit [Blastomonas sp.]